MIRVNEDIRLFIWKNHMRRITQIPTLIITTQEIVKILPMSKELSKWSYLSDFFLHSQKILDQHFMQHMTGMKIMPKIIAKTGTPKILNTVPLTLTKFLAPNS